MTTQVVAANVANSMMAREFGLTATDGVVFTTSNLVDKNAGQNLGILIPSQTISQIQMTYATSGLGQWRIYDSVNQRVSRVGWLSSVGYVCPMETQIQPYQVSKTDLLQCFIKQTNATAGDTEVMAWLSVDGQQAQSFQCTTADNLTPTEMKNSITDVSLGDAYFGKRLNRIEIACETGAFLASVQITDQTGSIVWSGFGSNRLPTAGGKSTMKNFEIPVGIMVQKGWSIFALTVTA
jgi:hypothetical protein